MSTQLKEEWQYIDKPLEEVRRTNGLVEREPEGTERTEKDMRKKDREMSKKNSEEVLGSIDDKNMQWCKCNSDKKEFEEEELG